MITATLRESGFCRRADSARLSAFFFRYTRSMGFTRYELQAIARRFNVGAGGELTVDELEKAIRAKIGPPPIKKKIFKKKGSPSKKKGSPRRRRARPADARVAVGGQMGDLALAAFAVAGGAALARKRSRDATSGGSSIHNRSGKRQNSTAARARAARAAAMSFEDSSDDDGLDDLPVAEAMRRRAASVPTATIARDHAIQRFDDATRPILQRLCAEAMRHASTSSPCRARLSVTPQGAGAIIEVEMLSLRLALVIEPSTLVHTGGHFEVRSGHGNGKLQLSIRLASFYRMRREDGSRGFNSQFSGGLPKGFGVKVLCTVLSKVVSSGLLSPDEIIWLEPDESESDALVQKVYRPLGFTRSFVYSRHNQKVLYAPIRQVIERCG